MASAILHTCLQGFSHVMQSTRVYWWVTLHVAPTFEWFPPDMELWLWLMPPSQVSGWCTLIPNLGHAKLPGNRDQVSQSLTWLGGGGGGASQSQISTYLAGFGSHLPPESSECLAGAP